MKKLKNEFFNKKQQYNNNNIEIESLPRDRYNKYINK